MKNTIHRVAIVSLLAASAAFAQTGGGTARQEKSAPSKAHILTVAEVDSLLARPAEILVIDVRRPDEVTTIGGFPAYLSIQAADLEKNLAYIPKGRTIITVSNHAARAGRAADLLASKGFKVAGATGAETYGAEGGHNVTKIAIPPPRTTAAVSGAAKQ